MKKTDIQQYHINQVKDSYERLGNIQKVKNEIGDALGLSYENVRYIVKELLGNIEKQQDQLQDLNQQIQEQKTYEVENDHYIFYKKVEDENGDKVTRKFPISIDTVNRIFKAYSKHGKNKTGEQIIQEFGIKPELFQLIKNRLRLYKDSHILSPVSLERFEGNEEEMEAFIEGAVDDNIQDKYIRKFQNAHERKFKEEAKKAMKRLAEIDDFLEHMKEYIQYYEPKQVDFVPKEPSNNKVIDITISDIHIGKMNTENIHKRLEKVAGDIINHNEGYVNIFCLGDLAEMLVEGGRHEGQIESMDGPYGFDLFMETVKTMEDFLIKIRESGKKVNFVGITGNHGVLSAKEGGDKEFTGELLIYELIKRGLQNTKIEIDYLRGMRNTYSTENFFYVINHGTGPQTNKKSTDILWEHGDSTRYNILMQGDKHTSKMEEVNEKATRLLVPCLAGANSYDKELAVSSQTGYTTIQKNDDGLPDIKFIKLK